MSKVGEFQKVHEVVAILWILQTLPEEPVLLFFKAVVQPQVAVVTFMGHIFETWKLTSSTTCWQISQHIHKHSRKKDEQALVHPLTNKVKQLHGKVRQVVKGGKKPYIKKVNSLLNTPFATSSSWYSSTAALYPISVSLQLINLHNLVFKLNLNSTLPSELIWLFHIYPPGLISPCPSESAVISVYPTEPV